jgi:CheY-like chemotaxis protein
VPSTTATAKQPASLTENLYALVVTDSKLTQKYVSAILREIIDLGDTRLAEDREAAIKLIQAHPTQHCGFIFYEDTEAPDSHTAFIEALRQQNETANTPIVVLGQKVPEDHNAEHARQQLTNFLQRPFVPSSLVSLLFELFQEKDRRLAKRIKTANLPCTVDMGYYATKPYEAELLNISYTGCLVRTRHDFDDCGSIDDIGSIGFNNDKREAIKLSGKIVRIDEGDYHQIGFQFQNNEEEDLVKLGRMISALSKQS